MESLELEVEEPVAGLAVRLLDEDLAEVVHVLDHVQHLEILVLLPRHQPRLT